MNVRMECQQNRGDRYDPEICMSGTAGLKFVYVRTLEQLEILKQFALDFKHEITCAKFPYVLIYYGDERELVGYAQIVNIPVVFPALHPDKVSPRAVTEIMKAFVGQAKLNQQSMQEGLVAVPLDTNTFERDVMLKMGFVDTNHKLYAVAGD